MENEEPIHASTIIQRILRRLKPKPSCTNGGNDISLEDIKASIAEREKLRDTMRIRWLNK